MVRKCDNCGTENGPLHRCTGCKQVCYCSKQCQREDWSKTHKINCKLTQIDAILLDFAKDEKTGFMELNYLDQKLEEVLSLFLKRKLRKLPELPDVMSFINPLRYLTNITSTDWELRQKMRQQQAVCKFDCEPFKNMDLSIKHSSVCSEVFGTMQYLAMCAKSNNYLHFHLEIKSGQEKVKKVIYDFVHKNNGIFSILFVFFSLSQYDLEGDRVHYFCVIKLHDKYRLIQSFGKKFSLEQDLKQRDWMNHQEIGKILDAFIMLERIGIIEDININKMKKYSKLCLGFELMADNEQQKEHHEISAVIMNDLSLKDWMSAAKHLLSYLAFIFEKFEKKEFGSIAKESQLRYRTGYPICMDLKYLKKINHENDWKYKI